MTRYPFSLLLLSFLLFQTAFAQEAEEKTQKQPKIKKDFQYHKEISGGFSLQTNGFAASIERGWIRDIFRTHLIEVEYVYYMDFKQKKTKATPVDGQSGKDYFYGFQNHLHVFHVSYGFKRMIADKAPNHGVMLSLVGFGGFSLAMLKPYYLDIKHYTDPNFAPTITHTRYTPETAANFLNKDSIDQASGFLYGWDHISFLPGIHAKLGLNFDWGTKDAYVKALEAGITLDLFFNRLPIYANDNNKFYLAGAYVGFHFGRRK